MVAQHKTPGEPPRSLSPKVAEQLEAALRVLAHSDTAENLELLHQALRVAGADARQHGLRPEELMLTFKDVERRLANILPGAGPSSAQSLRTRLIQILLTAYYA